MVMYMHLDVLTLLYISFVFNGSDFDSYLAELQTNRVSRQC